MSPELKTILIGLLETPSPTADIAGVSKVQALLATRLKALGFKLRHEYPPGHVAQSAAPFLIAERRGQGAHTGFITLVSHADTVDGFAHSVKVDTSGKRVVGQGVLDDKASQVVGLWGLELFLKAHPGTHLSFRFLSSPNEEQGSVGFTKTYAKLSKDSTLVLGFEPATERGEIIVSRRGNRWYRVTFAGREAHAGRAPQMGINAAFAAARAMVKLEKLNDYAAAVSVCVTSLRSAREAPNVVCGEVEMRIDFRFGDFRSRDLVDKKIRQILNAKDRGKSSPKGRVKVRVEVVDDCPPMDCSSESRRLAEVYARGLTVGLAKAISSGGSADVCYLSRPGLSVLDGLGAVGGGMHSDNEWCDLASIEIRAEALAKFLTHF